MAVPQGQHEHHPHSRARAPQVQAGGSAEQALEADQRYKHLLRVTGSGTPLTMAHVLRNLSRPFPPARQRRILIAGRL